VVSPTTRPAAAPPDVTRVARVTGLDRTGVEVACAIRPMGHVLQVANGKGLTFERAVASALSEAAELWASERVDPLTLRWATFGDLARARLLAWSPLELGSAGACDLPELWSPSLRMAWSTAKELFSGQPLHVPAQALHCLREGDWPLGPQLVRWTTNGMGAHPRRSRAVLHALLEAIERDQLARALPQGWTPEVVRRRLVRLGPATPQTARRVEALRRRGFDAYLFDLAPKGALGVPVAGALLFDREEGPVPLTAGYACGLSPDDALHQALLEAAQSRLTDVHGAREDVSPSDPEGARSLRALCVRAVPRRQAPQMGRVRGRRPVPAVLAKLWAAGHRRAAVATLSPAGSPTQVVKVVVPSFRVSDLL
jgi:ribosomal protein S12 methylthiotransferase accessory factor